MAQPVSPRVLVTGAAGFVGINIVRRLAEHGATVVALVRQPPDAATQSFIAPVADRVSYLAGDVRDRSGLLELCRTERITHIVHGAAVTSAEAEREDPAGFVDVNLGGTLNLLEAARAVGAQRFVLISSTAVYGAPRDRERLIEETDALQIGGIYSICKQAGEELCRRYRELFGLSTVVGRLGTAYGPMERPSGSRASMSQVHSLVHAALAGRQPKIYGADRLRDVCYIDDVAEIFARLTLRPQLAYGVYNVSQGTAHSLNAIAAAVAELVPGLRWSSVEQPDQADLVVLPPSERGPLDMRRAREDLEFTPRFPLHSGLAAYLPQLRSADAANR
jgi:nucleoside-diphosphate-sugar epimerase